MTSCCSRIWRIRLTKGDVSPMSLRPHLALPRRWDVEHLAIFGHRAPGDRIAGLAELIDQVLVGERVGFVLARDDVEELLLDGFPGHFLASGRMRAAAEKPLEREDTAR